MDLFKGDSGIIKRDYLIEIETKEMHQKAMGLFNGMWATTLKIKNSDLSIYEKKPTKTIKISSPVTTLRLPIGYTAFCSFTILMPYYQAKEQFETKCSFLSHKHDSH